MESEDIEMCQHPTKILFINWKNVSMMLNPPTVGVAQLKMGKCSQLQMIKVIKRIKLYWKSDKKLDLKLT
ncbi:putative absent in melanoma 1 protein isoform X1 [Sesbania bispinosa]|nr:putative absent in melanoma 1 protein isoform X1 [Sesbania bispinosa]